MSELSENNMMHQFNTLTVAQASLAMSIFKIASVAEGVRTFSEACYTLEGDLCLILRALSVFRRMELCIDNEYHTPRLEYSVDRALTLLQSLESNHGVQVKASNTNFTVASGKFTSM